MKQNNTLKPAPLHLARTSGQAKVEEVLSGFWLYTIAQMGEVLDGALWAHGQLHSAACELSLSADIATLGSGLGSGLAEPQKVQAFVESAVDLEEMLGQVETLGGLLRRAVAGCQDGRGDFKLSDPDTRARLFAFLREDGEAWSIFGESGYDWALLQRQARAQDRAQ